ncbi:MAG: serine--tRNA ligase [Thermoproteota archaeon]|nr:serine--tRNA ligase [Thermoproteota archaeon]
MIDTKVLKENPDAVKEMLLKRNIQFPLDRLLESDRKRRTLITELQDKYHKKNLIAKEIASKKRSNKQTENELEEMEQIGTQIKNLEREQRENEDEYKKLIYILPNFFHDSVPIGKDERDNKLVNIFKEVTIQPKNHIEMAETLDLLDLERAGKIAGARFYFIKNDLVRLSLALTTFAIDFLMKEGYTILQPPYMIKKEAMEGAVNLGDFEETIYKIENEDLFMIGTSEHSLASMHMNEILDGKRLPLKYASISPCFRKEAGAHGKDMKGIFRVHQFEKVEQFIFSDPEHSWTEHEKLLKTTERFYELLDIPFRTIVLSSGDLGKVSAKTYDIEAWFPAQQAYREICSCSNCTDYQARRLKIRYRNSPNEETKLVHTLNSTLVAIQRTLVAIMENNQTKRQTIKIPQVLQKYMNEQEEIGQAQ